MRLSAVSKRMLKWIVLQAECKAMCNISFGWMKAGAAMF